MDLISKVEINDLDEEQRRMAEIIGIDGYRQLVSHYGGISIYVRKPERVSISTRNEMIRNEYDGTNVEELALKFGITEVWVRNIVAERARELKRKPIEGQIGLFY